EVNPALKAGNLAKARKSFKAFDDNWDSIEDLIKARSEESYVAIEKGMIEGEQALMPDKPDVDKVTGLVNDILRLYNGALAEVRKEARGHLERGVPWTRNRPPPARPLSSGCGAGSSPYWCSAFWAR